MRKKKLVPPLTYKVFLQVAKVIEEMATQTTAIATRAHSAEKDLKKVQARLAASEQAEQQANEQVSQLADQASHKDKEIAELKTVLVEAKKREINPGNF